MLDMIKQLQLYPGESRTFLVDPDNSPCGVHEVLSTCLVDNHAGPYTWQEFAEQKPYCPPDEEPQPGQWVYPVSFRQDLLDGPDKGGDAYNEAAWIVEDCAHMTDEHGRRWRLGGNEGAPDIMAYTLCPCDVGEYVEED